jgi:glycosyltransferase involved in cell wall biosynthesis
LSTPVDPGAGGREPRLLVVAARELTRDVRARREVEAALAAGVAVSGLCIAFASEQPIELRGAEIARLSGDRISGTLRKAGLGGYRDSRLVARELRGIWRLARLAKTTARLVRAGRALGRFDVVHANDLDTLPAAYLLARDTGTRLVYDAHELYRFTETAPPRLYSLLTSALEAWISRHSDTVVTNCDLFAAELQRLLRLQRAPVVVLNCPDPISELPEPPGLEGPLKVIYQAAVDHPGRPVSDLLVAAEHAPGAQITIRLVDVARDRLEQEIADRGLQQRVLLSDAVPPDQLVEGLAGFDVGVIVNRDVTPNVALAVPGKLWEYMMASLASVVPDLPGLAFVDGLGIGITFPVGEPELMGAALQALAEDRRRLATMRARARALALERFNSATQADVLREVWKL